MRYAGLTKLGKKAFCVNFTLLNKLKITTKEAILLQQIEFVNKKSDFLVLPFTILSKITNMSRGHLYRCLSKLKKIGLIVVTDEGIAITDFYRDIKEQDFLENHSKNKALKQKRAKKSQNVACEKEAFNTNDEFYYTQYRCDDIMAQDEYADNAIQNITEKSNLAKNAKSVACEQAQTKTLQNTQENKALNSQNSHSFFVTNLSQNVTNLSQNETPIYNKEYNNISLCDTSHKEYIYSLPKEAANKKQGLRDSLALLLADLKKESCNLDNLKISTDIYNELAKEFQKKVFAQSKIKPNAFYSKLSDEVKKKINNFMLSLNTSLLFLSVEAKKAFFADLETLANSDMLEKAIEYSSKNKLLWICLDSDDSKGKKYLKALYVDMQKELDKKIKMLRLEYVKSMSKEQILHEVVSQYGNKIDEFIAYREARNKYFNKHAFHALLDTLSAYFMQGEDIVAMLEQSVCRGYNWVFPLTHNSRKRRCV